MLRAPALCGAKGKMTERARDLISLVAANVCPKWEEKGLESQATCPQIHRH